MRAILLAALLFLPVRAVAFNGEEAVAVYNDFRPACRQAELSGEAISATESQKYCVAIEAIAAQLQANGWCFNSSEVEWRKCD